MSVDISELEERINALAEKMRLEFQAAFEEEMSVEDKLLTEMTHDELVPLIMANYDNPDKLFEIADAIRENTVLTDEEKQRLWNLIDKPP